MAATTPEDRHQLDDNKGPSIIAASGILLIATTVSVALRLWAQKMIKSRFDIDDYLIVGALASLSGFRNMTLQLY